MPVKRGSRKASGGYGTIIIIVLGVLFIGMLLSMAFLSSSRQSISSSSSSTSGATQQDVRETVVITQPQQPQITPFLYENTELLQRPPVKPFYLPTRGEPSPYQQMGVLIGEEHGKSGEQMILPLIGRQTHPGSSKYHYYTSTNGFHPMKLPVEHNKRTCNDGTGCDEIYSGNMVRVKGYDVDFNADVYPSADPLYIQ